MREPSNPYRDDVHETMRKLVTGRDGSRRETFRRFLRRWGYDLPTDGTLEPQWRGPGFTPRAVKDA